MKILVRNLERTVTEPELLKLFQGFGTVESCTLVLDAATGKSKGFAFVEMPHAREAIKAVKGLNTLRLHGPGISVKLAEDKPRAANKSDIKREQIRLLFYALIKLK